MKYLALILSLLIAAPAEAVIALVTNVAVGNTTTPDAPEATAAVDTTGADLLVCVQTHYGSEEVYGGAVTDSKSNTWTEGTNNNSDTTIRIYFATNVAGKVGTGHTFSTGGYQASMECMAFSGTHTTAPLDQQAASAYTPYADNLRSLATGSITPSENGTVVIAGWSTSELTGSSGSVDGGFTITNQINLDNSAGVIHLGSFAAYLIQTTATAANPTGSWSNQMSVGAVIASFKSAPAGGSTRRPIAPIVIQ